MKLSILNKLKEFKVGELVEYEDMDGTRFGVIQKIKGTNIYFNYQFSKQAAWETAKSGIDKKMDISEVKICTKSFWIKLIMAKEKFLSRF